MSTPMELPDDLPDHLRAYIEENGIPEGTFLIHDQDADGPRPEYGDPPVDDDEELAAIADEETTWSPEAEQRVEFLAEVAKIVANDRNTQYGEPEDNFARISDLWASYLQHNISVSDVAAMMALLKIARIAVNPLDRDSWLDVAGYAACAGALTEATK